MGRYGARMRVPWQRLTPEDSPFAIVIFAMLTGVTVLAGCGEEAEDSSCSSPEPRIVAEADGWVAVPSSADPFWESYEGDPVVCAADSHGLEEGTDGAWWGIETVTCGYLTLEQPTSSSLCAGDELVLRLWHFNLLDTGADFRVALSTSDEPPILDATVPVPASAELVELRALLVDDVPAGEPLRFHLSNHGTNSWGLMDIVAQ